MRIMISLLFLSLLASCGSSQPERSQPKPKRSQESYPELQGISDSDFRPTETVAYESFEDQFDPDQGFEDDSLVRESIGRLDNARLQKIQASGDVISSIISLCHKKDFNTAFALIDQNYAKYRKHAGFWNQVGSCYFLQNEFKKALLFYNKSIELNKNYAPPVNNLGVIFLKKGQDQKALVAFKKATGFNRFSLTPKFNMAQLYLEYGLVDKALPIFEGIYSNNQKDPDIIIGLANCFLFQGNVGQAIEYFSQLSAGNLRRPAAGLNYAVALKTQGQAGQAKTVFSQVDRRLLGPLKSYYAKVGRFVGAL